MRWRECLAAHWDVLAAADCFTVEVWTPRGLTRVTVLVLIHLASRRGQIAGISAEPDGPGVPQLMRNATDAADGFLRHIRFLIHDRDPRFRPAVRAPLPPADVTPLRRPARAPNLNAYTERFVRTIKESCLERMGLIGEGSRRRAVREFVAHSQCARPVVRSWRGKKSSFACYFRELRAAVTVAGAERLWRRTECPPAVLDVGAFIGLLESQKTFA